MKADVCYASLADFLDHWDGVRMVTLKLLTCFEAADLSYKLVPEWRTVGELFHHIGAQQYYVARGVFTGRWEARAGEPDAAWDDHERATSLSVAALEGWLTENQASLRRWTQDAAPEQLSHVRDDNPWHAGMRGWLLLQHPYQDELHHQGQLYAVARLLGKNVPEVYAEEYPEYWNARKVG